MKDFLAFFVLSFIVCYLVVAFGLSNAWVLIALLAVILGALLTALFSLERKAEALEKRLAALEAKEKEAAESAPPEPEA